MNGPQAAVPNVVSSGAYRGFMEEFQQEGPTAWRGLPSRPAGAFSLLEYHLHRTLVVRRLRLLYPEAGDPPNEAPSLQPDFAPAPSGYGAPAAPRRAKSASRKLARRPELSARQVEVFRMPAAPGSSPMDPPTQGTPTQGAPPQAPPPQCASPRSIASFSSPDQPPPTARELEITADTGTSADWRDVWEQVPPATLAVLLDAVDVCSLSDADTLDYLAATGRVTAWAQALKVRGMARFAEHRAEDGTGVTGHEGHSRFAAGEIAPHIHQSKRSVSKELADAVQLWNWLPGTVTAMESGTIDLPRATAIAHGARGLPDDLLPVYEANVLPGAENITKESLQNRIRRVRNDLHPESLTVRHAREMEGRGVSFFPQEDGMAELYIRTSADKALLIYDLLQTHAKSLKTAGETRTLGQLRADVLADLLLETPGHAFRTATDTGTGGLSTSSLSPGGLSAGGLGTGGACGSCGRGPGPVTTGGNITASVAVTISLATAAGISTEPGHLAGYGPVPPETARNIAALAKSWLPVLIDESGEAVAVAKEMRHPPEWLKRLVRLRDESCRGPGCLAHSRHCELDHTVAWEAGGKTELGNLAPYCKPDHIAKHEGGWRTTQEDKGVLRHQGKSGHTYISYPDGTWIRLGVQPPPEPPPDPFADPTPPPF